VPGRKTDVSDAAWLRQLHSYGLLRGSFRPDAEIATLRAYLRQRERLVEYAAAHIQHMQKALMEMNLQLHHVVSDITGATGMRIIRAIVGGERNPDVLATYRDVRCHSSTETIRAALVGNDREEHDLIGLDKFQRLSQGEMRGLNAHRPATFCAPASWPRSSIAKVAFSPLPITRAIARAPQTTSV
jgi:hypothetical protein